MGKVGIIFLDVWKNSPIKPYGLEFIYWKLFSSNNFSYHIDFIEVKPTHNKVHNLIHAVQYLCCFSSLIPSHLARVFLFLFFKKLYSEKQKWNLRQIEKSRKELCKWWYNNIIKYLFIIKRMWIVFINVYVFRRNNINRKCRTQAIYPPQWLLWKNKNVPTC